MNTQTHHITILNSKRIKSSNMGNPRFEHTYIDLDGFQQKAIDAPNASHSYAIGNHDMTNNSTVEVTYNKRGQITTMRPVETSFAWTDEAYCH